MEGCAIIFCNDGFGELTGFSRAELMQKSCCCEFLYGENTSEEGIEQIKCALEKGEESQVEITFYKKDGESLFSLSLISYSSFTHFCLFE